MLLTDDEVKARVAENIQRLLVERDWTQADLARATGENDARISLAVRGLKVPSIAFVARIADVLEVSTDYLLAPSRKKIQESA